MNKVVINVGAQGEKDEDGGRDRRERITNFNKLSLTISLTLTHIIWLHTHCTTILSEDNC